jgi:hypothetical protein
MKRKDIIILAAILVFLLGTLLIKKVLMRPAVETTEYKSLELSISPSEMYALKASRSSGKESLRLERDDRGEWIIPAKGSIGADKTKIEALMNALAVLSGELRSRSKALFDDYGISEDKAFTLELIGRDGTLLEKLYFGSKKPGFGGLFLRVGDSEEVYLVNRDIFPLFGIYGALEDGELSGERWADLSLINIDIGSVDSIKIEKPGPDGSVVVNIKREFDQEKNLKKWNALIDEPETGLDAGKIKAFLTEINTIKGMKIVDSKIEDYGLENPYMILSLAAPDQDAMRFIIGNEETESSGNRYLKNHRGYIFLTRKYVIDKLDITMEKFAADPPEPEPDQDPEPAPETPAE